jgi:hypothetical protein
MDDQLKPVFDANREIEFPRGDGQDFVLTYPTDEAWLARQRRRKTVMKSIGRGESETIIKNQEVSDLELVLSCLKPDSVQPDEYEAVLIVDKLSKFELLDSSKDEEGNIVVECNTLFGTVRATMKSPTAKDVIKHRRHGSTVRDTPVGSEVLINIAYSAGLFDTLFVKAEGYVTDIPVVHKWQFVAQAINQFESLRDNPKSEVF